jgi:hypothetical protein
MATVAPLFPGRVTATTSLLPSLALYHSSSTALRHCSLPPESGEQPDSTTRPFFDAVMHTVLRNVMVFSHTADALRCRGAAAAAPGSRGGSRFSLLTTQFVLLEPTGGLLEHVAVVGQHIVIVERFSSSAGTHEAGGGEEVLCRASEEASPEWSHVRVWVVAARTLVLDPCTRSLDEGDNNSSASADGSYGCCPVLSLRRLKKSIVLCRTSVAKLVVFQGHDEVAMHVVQPRPSSPSASTNNAPHAVHHRLMIIRVDPPLRWEWISEHDELVCGVACMQPTSSSLVGFAVGFNREAVLLLPGTFSAVDLDGCSCPLLERPGGRQLVGLILTWGLAWRNSSARLWYLPRDVGGGSAAHRSAEERVRVRYAVDSFQVEDRIVAAVELPWAPELTAVIGSAAPASWPPSREPPPLVWEATVAPSRPSPSLAAFPMIADGDSDHHAPEAWSGARCIVDSLSSPLVYHLGCASSEAYPSSSSSAGDDERVVVRFSAAFAAVAGESFRATLLPQHELHWECDITMQRRLHTSKCHGLAAPRVWCDWVVPLAARLCSFRAHCGVCEAFCAIVVAGMVCLLFSRSLKLSLQP